MMNKDGIQTPVCIFIFLRKSQSLNLVSKIREVHPPRLYIVGEGPRPGRDGEADKVNDIRKAVQMAVDWNCEIKTNYVSEDIGAGRRIETGISWVFEHESKCIFLEDDIVPSTSFFYYCEELLNRYEFDMRVGMISGYNALNSYMFAGSDYGFSKCGSIYGWATWANRWAKYDWDMRALDDEKANSLLLHDLSGNNTIYAKRRIQHWEKAKKDIVSGKLSTWDYQWSLTRRINGWLDIVPSESLTGNHGVDENASNTASDDKLLPKRAQKLMSVVSHECLHELVHPKYFIADHNYDDTYMSLLYPPKIQLKFEALAMKIKMVVLKK